RVLVCILPFLPLLALTLGGEAMRAVSIASSMPSPAGDESSASKAFDTSGQPPQTDESGMSRRVSPYRVDRAFDLELLESRRLLSADGSSAGAGLTATYYDQI